MDVDETLLRDWEDESFAFDDDDDFAFALSLQSQFASSSNSQPPKSDKKNENFLKSLDDDLDYAFALSLQAEFMDDFQEVESDDSEKKKSVVSASNISKPMSIVDEQWEFIDPHPDIHALFLEYDKRFFFGKLVGVEVRWSPRMTLCAGVCSYEGRGGLCSVRLSVPLLKLRPRRDLVETLLHEMIHAYLFVTHNNKDREGHGPEFLSHMNRINKETGTRISVYHSFHDEVDAYRQHWWKCDGPCKNRRPFFGLVKRAMNRAPGPKDNWWAAHQASCSGKFIKIKEPDNYKKKATKRKAMADLKSNTFQPNIKGFFKETTPSAQPEINLNKLLTKSTKISTITAILAKEDNTVPINSKTSPKKSFAPFKGVGHKLGRTTESIPNHSKLYNSNFADSFNIQTDLLSSSRNVKLPVLSGTSELDKIAHSSKSSSTDLVSVRSNEPVTPTKQLVQSPIERFLSPTKLSPGIQQISVLKRSPSHERISDIVILNEIVKCPVCSKALQISEINRHLDKCIQT